MHCFIFKFKAPFGSKLRASENKPILRIFLKRSLIYIRSSNLTYLAPLEQFLMGAKLILGNYEKNVPKSKLIWALLKCMVAMATCNVNLKKWGVPTKSIIPQLLLTKAH